MIELIELIVCIVSFSALIGIYIELNKTNDILHYMSRKMDEERKNGSTPPPIPS